MVGTTPVSGDAALFIGTAGWAIPRESAAEFPTEGTTLERYAARFNAVEVNSSFHRRHRATTWQRWSESVPDDFRFSVKMPKEITHQLKLRECRSAIEEFFDDVAPLAGKLAIVLVQLPPSLSFDDHVASIFLNEVRSCSDVRLAIEPRHASWFTPQVNEMLVEADVARVAADPAKPAGADQPGGERATSYWRWHGSPVMYRSSYDDYRLAVLSRSIRASSHSSRNWIIFDNTAGGAATQNGLALQKNLTMG